MSKSLINHVKISGISCVVPKENVHNKDNVNFEKQSLKKAILLTGIEDRRVTSDSVCTSDLCLESAKVLLKDIGWDKNDVEALIFVSQTPDHTLPATACLLQDRLGLPSSCAAFDVNLGCSGYVYGLWLASTIVSKNQFKKVLLLVGDTCSKFVSPKDQSSVLLFGDAGSATALEYDPDEKTSYFVLGTDGSGGEDLMIKSGGYRFPYTESSAKRVEQLDGAIRSDVDLYMKGGNIFNFTIKRVPELLQSLLEYAGIKETDDIDQFYFHQANKYMLDYLVRKLKIDRDKVPLSLKEYGNTSSASIPLTIVSSLKNIERKEDLNVAMLGFGVGFSWGGCVMNLSKDMVVSELEI